MNQDTQISPQHASIIFDVLTQVAPLEVDVAGEVTAKRVASGYTFQAAKGGSQLDLTTTIGLISGIASLTHLMLLALISAAKKVKMRLSKTEIIKRTIIDVEKHKKLRELIEANPDLLSDIYNAINTLHVLETKNSNEKEE